MPSYQAEPALGDLQIRLSSEFWNIRGLHFKNHLPAKTVKRLVYPLVFRPNLFLLKELGRSKGLT